MGVKRKLTIDEIKYSLNEKIEFKNIYPSLFGATDTVYFLDDNYVLKLYEKSSLNQIQNEIFLYQKLSNFKISKLALNEIFYIQNKPCLLFIKSKAGVLKDIKNIHLIQIAQFLKSFHFQTKELKLSNKDVFSFDNFEKELETSKEKRFKTIYENLDLILQKDGLIHGDLFVDNALFLDSDLECVIDFNEVCIGDYNFELAVVIISWCDFDENFTFKAKSFLDSYNKNIRIEHLKNYMIYACLFYAVFREKENRDYSDLLRKIEFINRNFNG